MTVVLLSSTGGAAAAAAPPATSSSSAAAAAVEPGPSMPVYYLVKWITWKEKKTPIVTQSENGPCPLLAIMNTLFLRWKVKDQQADSCRHRNVLDKQILLFLQEEAVVSLRGGE